MKRQQPGKQWYGSGRQQGGTHAPNLNDAPPRLNQQHHLHLTVIMRSQGSSPMLRCVQADSMMLQTRECKSIWILDQPGSGSVRVGPDFCAIFHAVPQSHTHPHSPRLERVPPKTRTEYNLPACPREKSWRKMSTPRGSSLVPPPTPTFSQEVVSTHMRGGGSIRIADCLMGRGRGRGEGKTNCLPE